ncbi:PAS domain-containing sensor histidine kinase [Patescibacteria group bacterium]|nr:PAS domain-containing sensor histidine kinase [Patescibacteria group bacterium]
MRGKVNIRYKFLIASVFFVLIAGALSFYVAGIQLQKYILDSHLSSVSNYVNSLSREYFDFSESTSLKKSGDPVAFSERLLKDNNLKDFVLTDANGTIIYASNKKIINTGVHTDTNWKNAITGIGFVTDLDHQDRCLTNYIPLISESNNVRGVVYFNSEVPRSFELIRSFQLEVAAIVIIVSLFFTFVAYFIMYELENQMNYQERSVNDASRALEEEQRLYEAITTSLAEALIVINHDGQIILFNTEAEKLTDHKASDVEYRSYKNIITIFDENNKKVATNPIEESLKSGKLIRTSSKDGYRLKKDGKLIPINMSVAPITSEKSFVKGVSVTIEDISAEQELQKVKDEFVYLVAHELGNPIFALDGYLTILESSIKKIDPNTKDILKSAKGINNQLSTLVNDLLEVSRNETGRLTFEMEKIKLTEIFETVINNESFKAKEKHIEISFKKSKLPTVLGNTQKIKEVATNLINNAIKYTPNGGRVSVIFENDGKLVTSHVKDSGIGLSEENKKHLFEKFFRAKDKETEGITGTGLGLFISKQIIEKCNGKIWAESEKGKGSTFSFSLKIAK